jgi:hypothetical protein
MAPPPLKGEDAIKTYRYLRLGMVAAVLCLGAAILIEHGNVAQHCWQTSISAYYYTPVRAIFVGGLIAIGMAMIVIKGRSDAEDLCLNMSGMLAFVVAIAPTTDVKNHCWSNPPDSFPVLPDGSLAHWVRVNVDNNFDALLIAGAIGLVIASAVVFFTWRGTIGAGETVKKSTVAGLAFTGIALLAAWWLIVNWNDFYTQAHGKAAAGMFLFQIAVVAFKAVEHREDSKWYVAVYTVVAGLMLLGGIIIGGLRLFGDHTVFALEIYEITLFAVFWLFQTGEYWNEQPA